MKIDIVKTRARTESRYPKPFDDPAKARPGLVFVSVPMALTRPGARA